jgi:hypothetical protein
LLDRAVEQWQVRRLDESRECKCATIKGALALPQGCGRFIGLRQNEDEARYVSRAEGDGGGFRKRVLYLLKQDERPDGHRAQSHAWRGNPARQKCVANFIR